MVDFIRDFIKFDVRFFHGKNNQKLKYFKEIKIDSDCVTRETYKIQAIIPCETFNFFL